MLRDFPTLIRDLLSFFEFIIPMRYGLAHVRR